MVDYKLTIEKIHSAMPELTTDELLVIMDCITEMTIFKNNSSTNNNIKDWIDYTVNAPLITHEVKDNCIRYTTETKNCAK